MTARPAFPVSTPPVVGLICAAGKSERFGGGVSKLLQEVAGSTVFARSCAQILRCPGLRALVVACRDEERSALESTIVSFAAHFPADGVRFTSGGATRQESVWNALSFASRELKLGADELVLVHDAARCLIHADSIVQVVQEAAASGAATLAVPVTDTIVRAEGRPGARGVPAVGEFLRREGLWSVQTPQVARAQLLQAAHARAKSNGVTSATDDAGLIREIAPVSLVLGRADNIKVTHPCDVAYAASLLAVQSCR